MNIVVPMSGRGSRFSEANYRKSKPFIQVRSGVPMIREVLNSLNLMGRYIFVVRQEQIDENPADFEELLSNYPDHKVIALTEMTEGACCSVLKAEEYINHHDPLVICNADQVQTYNPFLVALEMGERKADACILTFESNQDKWSFAKLDDRDWVSEVKEKEVISNNATCGVYFYRFGCDFVSAAKKMIRDNYRVKNEFFVSPVFNYMIGRNQKVMTYEVDQFWGLGDPNSLESYQKEFNLPNIK
jgi:UDP-N-acetylglucosamine diphosphorylase / glucose-1-phosphate thymidylyltransferase / UDP-N-acetylgalactosamine diphosphorylase / glucosamine-1-phosphate N-acetyltransferase / galactosamine-1-phosphate N-acetyltransferase